MNRLAEQEYHAALQASLESSYVQIAQNDDDIMMGAISVRDPMDVERTAMFHEALYQLSAEAKEVVRLVLTVPAEMLELSTPINKAMTRRSLEQFLHHYFNWSLRSVRYVLAEIRIKLRDIDKEKRTTKEEKVRQAMITKLEKLMKEEGQ